jgi:hypothetical protein
MSLLEAAAQSASTTFSEIPIVSACLLALRLDYSYASLSLEIWRISTIQTLTSSKLSQSRSGLHALTLVSSTVRYL